MTITARYAGRCGKCGGSIEPGQSIEWDRETKRASHVKCPRVATTTAAPKVEAPRTDESNLLQADWATRDKGGPAIGHTYRSDRYGGQVLIVVKVHSRRVSQNEVDDQGDQRMGGNPYWLHTGHCRPATDEEAAPVLAREVARKAEAEAQAEAKRQAELADAESVAKVTQLLDGLTPAGGSFDLTGLAETGERETVASWRRGICDCLLIRLTLDGETCYLEDSRGIDDYRQMLHGPRAIVERAWQAWATKFGITPATAQAWLVRWSACYGHEAYEFAAKS